MSITEIIINLLKCLFLTIIIEGIFTLILTKSLRFLRYNLICNLLTNPLLNMVGMLIFSQLGTKVYTIWIIIGEIIVLLSEAYFYALLSSATKEKAFILSAITNLASFTLGSYILTLI